MRVFFSLEIPQEIKKEIGKIQKKLKQTGIQARWVKPEISHLTLVFLGTITPEKINPLRQIVTEINSQIRPIRLSFLKIGCLPSLTKPRVIFVSLKGELNTLNNLAIKIRKKLKKEKIYFDQKPFFPHLTLGRLKKGQNLTSVIERIKIPQVEFRVKQVSLVQSILTPSGPIYKTLEPTFLIDKLDQIAI